MRGKRWQGVVALIATAVTVGAGTGGAQAALTMRAFAAPAGGAPAMAADGQLVRPVFPSTVERVDGNGHGHGIGLPDDAGYLSTQPPTPLLDGGLALVAYGNAGQRLARIDPRGRATAVRVPNSGSEAPWDDQAIAPDGSLWRVDLCGDTLSRVSPRGVETRFHLRRLRCRGVSSARAWQGSTFAFGPDGTAWFASLCQARIVRVPLVGRRREWSLGSRPGCVVKQSTDDTRQDARGILPTANGGLLLPYARITAQGRLVHDRGTAPDAITANGAQWRIGIGGIERRRVGEHPVILRKPFHDGRSVIAWAPGADGRLWYLSARQDYEFSIGIVNVDVAIGSIAVDGSIEEQPLAAAGGPDDEVYPAIELAPDGAVWVGGPDAILRIAAVPPPVKPPAPTARATRLIGRRGGTAWVQVSCSGRLGTICSGSVRLVSRSRRSLVRRPARFAVPAGEGRAIPVVLTRAAARRHRLGARAVVTPR